jgi:hypothetical protein
MEGEGHRPAAAALRNALRIDLYAMKMHTILRAGAVVLGLSVVSAPNAIADGTSPTILVLSNLGSGSPAVGLVGMQYRVWDSNALAWGAATTIPSFTASGTWVVAKNCPTRNETAVVTISRSQALTLATFDGTAWSAGETLCSVVGESWGNRGADMVYSNSGRLVAAWWDYANARVGYRVGSSTGSFALPTADHVTFLSLVARPGSSQVLLLAANTQSKLYASVFNGAAFGTATEITAGLASTGYESFAGAYFGTPGRPVVIYGVPGDAAPRYRTLTSGVWSAEQTFSPGNTGVPCVFRLVRDPASGNLLTAFSSLTGTTKELTVARFTSTGWTGGAVVVPSALQFTDRRCFDLAFEPGGTNALLTYAASGTGDLRYRSFDGTSWTRESSGSNVASTVCVWGLFTGSASGEVFAMPYNTSNFLNGARWSRNPNGVGSLSSHTQLAKTLEGAQKARAFMIAGPTTPEASVDEPDPPRIVRWREPGVE